ncbi:hypothetical protein [Photobacterium profundum]|uniref:Uncharacterized protein n=1 Tax=Photobacterium profundum (strain SS9) TaxID=298386 RepID=Q6LQD6_PHOPR|nr:hypothetical protein [Photobacterium profundum]CAG20490.1 hypothetical protein PBPRA2088 [Photobacterium profundum SS9]
MSFSDYLDDFIKQRDQRPQSTASSQPFRRQPAPSVQDATNQSKAREAMAREQEEASERATEETKQPHTRIHGRCMTAQELYALDQQKVEAIPVSQSRLDYIQQLKKDLKLKKNSES